MLVHPLNQNPAVASEMRLLYPGYAGGPFLQDDPCYTLGGFCLPELNIIDVSPGADRVEETEIDYDVAIGRKLPFC